MQCADIVSLDLDGAIEVGDRAVGLALGAIRHAAIVVGEPVIRLELDGEIEHRDRAREFALGIIDVAQRVHRVDVALAELQRRFEIGDCVLDLAALAIEHAAAEQRPGVRAVERDRLAVAAQRAVGVALTGEALAALEQRVGFLLACGRFCFRRFRSVDDGGAGCDSIFDRTALALAGVDLFSGDRRSKSGSRRAHHDRAACRKTESCSALAQRVTPHPDDVRLNAPPFIVRRNVACGLVGNRTDAS